MQMTRWLKPLLLGLVYLVGSPDASAKAGQKLPAGVHLLAKGMFHGAVSPDGKWLAYWTYRGDLKLFSVAKFKPVGTLGKNPGGAGFQIAWANDSRHISTWLNNDGLYVVDTRSKRSQKIHASRDYPDVRAQAFSDEGDLYYVTHDLHRVSFQPGFAKPVDRVLSQPPNKPYKIQYAFPSPGVVSTSGSRGLLLASFTTGANEAVAELWTANLKTGQWRMISQADPGQPMLEPKFSPAQDRVCFRSSKGLSCVTVETGRQDLIASGYIKSWGADAYWMRPFSPSGNLLAYWVESKSDKVLFVHDFSSGLSKPLASVLPYAEFEFQDEQHVVVCDHGTGPRPQIVRFDLVARTFENLVTSDTNQYASLLFIPGVRDKFFSGRERGGTRDFVAIQVKPTPQTGPQPLSPVEIRVSAPVKTTRELLPIGAQCVDRFDCESAVCAGQGCGESPKGRCMPSSQTCGGEQFEYCTCDGKTIRQFPACPYRRTRHRGPCRAP
jgi:hypothetical protein